MRSGEDVPGIIVYDEEKILSIPSLAESRELGRFRTIELISFA